MIDKLNLFIIIYFNVLNNDLIFMSMQIIILNNQFISIHIMLIGPTML